MWIRFFRIEDGSTVKTQYFTNPVDAVNHAKRWVLINPNCDWEGL